MAWLALLVTLAGAGPIDIERARAGLALDDPPRALEDARIAVADAPDDWRAWAVYSDALEAAGLGHRVPAELSLAADQWPAVRVVLALHRAQVMGEGASAVADVAGLAGADHDVASWVMGTLALGAGSATVARTVTANAALPEARAVAIRAAVALGDGADAAARARTLMTEAPGRVDLLAGLFDQGAGTGPLRAAQRRAVRAAAALTTTDDPVAVYRARTLLVAAGAREEAGRAVARLVAMGEPTTPDRGPASAAMRVALARGLAMNAHPTLPDAARDESRDVGVAVALSLRDMGRIPEAIEVWRALRDQADDTALAVAHARQVLRTGRARDAAAIADEAIALASRPSPTDADRSAVRAWRQELALAYAVSAEARLAGEEPDVALQHAVIASLLAPTAENLRLRAAADAALGFPDAGWSSLATARALGEDVDGLLAQTYPGFGVWQDAAAATAQRWSDESGAELPIVDAGGLPERPDRPRVGAAFPTWGDDALGSDALKGTVYVVQFWASWCGPCKEEVPAVDALAARWSQGALAARAIAVSIDDADREMARFLQRHPLEHTATVRDPGLAERLGVLAVPTTWVVDGEGIARHYHQGYGPDALARLDDEVRALVH